MSFALLLALHAPAHAADQRCSELEHIRAWAVTERLDTSTLDALQSRYCPSAPERYATSPDCVALHIMSTLATVSADPDADRINRQAAATCSVGTAPAFWSGGQLAKNGADTWYYPNGTLAENGSNAWYSPDGQYVAGVSGLLDAACARVSAAQCRDVLAFLEQVPGGDQHDVAIVTFATMAWQAQ